jgi:hypothetical protein
MIVPKQSPPVERKTSVQAMSNPKDVKPQMTCECRQNSDGTRTYWCRISRSFYNTGEPC